MNSKSRSRPPMFWILPPLAVGIVVLVFMAAGKQPPVKVDRTEPTRAVRVIAAAEIDLVPRAKGYGTVQPAQVWKAVAQVSGRIIEMHPHLRNGEIIPAGSLLFRIDPVDYELNLLKARAQLVELEVEEKNTRALLSIEQRNLALAQREYQRIQKLMKKGTTSQSEVDRSERTVLGTRTAAQNMGNVLDLIPTQRKLLEVQIAQAERDISHATVTAPFNMRVAGLAIEADQYVSKGQDLFEGDAIERVEVIAQVAMSSLRNLFIGRADAGLDIRRFSEALSELTGFRPLIRMDLGNHIAEWEAEFVRFSDNVDPKTRTLGVVVAVDRPLEKVRPGYRPPLSKGMFVEVVLRGHTQPRRLVIPRTAVRGGKAYLVDGENRLRIQAVRVLFSQGLISVVENGIAAGQRVAVSDLVPAIEGMLLQPEVDASLQQVLSGVPEAAQ